jgi:hypothetical protein
MVHTLASDGEAMSPSAIARWLPRAARYALTLGAILSLGLAAVSYFEVDIQFGTPAYSILQDGRMEIHLPYEWAANEYSQDRPFPINTDSLLGIVTYWLPSPSAFHVDFHLDGEHEFPGLDPGWWRYWIDPFDFSTDGEYSETEARLIPIPLFVYATVPPCAAAWCFPRFIARRRRIAGCCRRCGYSLAGLNAATVCPECGANRA